MFKHIFFLCVVLLSFCNNNSMNLPLSDCDSEVESKATVSAKNVRLAGDALKNNLRCYEDITDLLQDDLLPVEPSHDERNNFVIQKFGERYVVPYAIPIILVVQEKQKK